MQDEFDLRQAIRALSDKYEVHRILGRSSLGAVLLARDRLLDRQVALKLIRPSVFADPEVRHGFLRQAKLMAKVRHANVVEIYELAQGETGVYFAMQYIRGQTLADLIESQGDAITLDDAIAILEPMSKGVAAIHSVGTTHHDLNPSNILLGPSFRVAVTDMGFYVPTDTLDSSPHGDPVYQAPELDEPQGHQSPFAKAADVYALGCIAYELLVGRPPFTQTEFSDLRRAHAQHPPQPPSEARAGLAREFDTPILSALQKDPRHRTPSAEQFRRELLEARDLAAERLDWAVEAFDMLIVDDDPDMLDWLELHLALRFPDANVRRAGNGLTAMELIDERVPDMVITDLEMPGLDGVELTRHLRTTPGGEFTPLIVVTAVGGAPDWAKLQALGADGFHLKPIDPDALAALVRKQIADATRN